MNSLIGMAIGTLIGLIIAILKSSKEYHALQGRRTRKFDEIIGENSQFHEDIVLKFEDFKTLEKHPNHPLPTKAEARALAEAERSDGDAPLEDQPDTPLDSFDKSKVVKVYKSREAGKMIAISFSILIGLALWVLYNFEIYFAVEDRGFLIRAGLEFLALFGPLIGVLIYYKRKRKKPVLPRDPILEFTPDGMICHSYKCGSVRQINWDDIVRFTPKLPVIGLSVAVEIEHQLSETLKACISKYAVNVLDLELVEFVELLENYTGLEAERY